MLQSHVEILYVGHKIPFIVLYDKLAQRLSFGLLQNRQESGMVDMIDEGETYIKSIEPESRHPEITQISKEHEIQIEELFSFNLVTQPPSKIFLSKALYSPYEVVISLFYEKQRRLD